MFRRSGTSAIRCGTIGTVIERFHARSQQLCIHTQRIQLSQDWFGTPTLLPFHRFGTPRWRTGRHEKKGLYDDHNRLETAEVYKYICQFPRPSRSCQLSKKSRRLYTARLRDRRSARATEKTIMEKPYLIIRCKNGIVRCCVYSFYVEVLIFGSQLHCQRLNFKHWDHWDHTIRRWVVTVNSNCSTSGRLTKRRW